MHFNAPPPQYPFPPTNTIDKHCKQYAKYDPEIENANWTGLPRTGLSLVRD